MKSRASSVKQWFGASAVVMAGLALNPLYVAMAAEVPQQQASALFDFNLAAKPLPQALNDFSRLTGLSVVYTDDAPLGLQAPVVKGRMSADKALQQLLALSGFNARRTDANTFALETPTYGRFVYESVVNTTHTLRLTNGQLREMLFNEFIETVVCRSRFPYIGSEGADAAGAEEPGIRPISGLRSRVGSRTRAGWWASQ